MSDRIAFESRVERLDTGLRMHVIPVPELVMETFPGVKRMIVRIGGVELRRALQGVLSGEPYVMIGLVVLKELGLRMGARVEAGIWPDPEPDNLHIAEEFEEALAQDDGAKERWDTFTPGKQRSLNHYVDSAKRAETRVKRAVELATKIRERRLYGD
jgi:hypothetical protein